MERGDHLPAVREAGKGRSLQWRRCSCNTVAASLSNLCVDLPFGNRAGGQAQPDRAGTPLFTVYEDTTAGILEHALKLKLRRQISLDNSETTRVPVFPRPVVGSQLGQVGNRVSPRWREGRRVALFRRAALPAGLLRGPGSDQDSYTIVSSERDRDEPASKKEFRAREPLPPSSERAVKSF